MPDFRAFCSPTTAEPSDLTLSAEESHHLVAVNRARASRWRNMSLPLSSHPRVRDLRQCGMIVAFEVPSARPDFARAFATAALQHELVLRPIGKTVYFMPPYVVTDDEFALIVERTLAILDAC